METIIINQNQAIELIKSEKFNSEYKVIFDNTLIEAHDAILLGKNGIDVPENLIFYDDDKIDYSDNPPINEEDLKSGKIKWMVHTDIPIEYEISNWLKQQKIDLSELAAQLIKNFYQTMKTVQKNAAM